jgi:hypothetical protein
MQSPMKPQTILGMQLVSLAGQYPLRLRQLYFITSYQVVHSQITITLQMVSECG